MVQTIQREFRSRGAKTGGGLAKSLGTHPVEQAHGVLMRDAPASTFRDWEHSWKGTHVSTGTSLEEFDLVILGGGTGGTVAAWTFASQGQRVAVIDRKYVGGSCPNIACLPSKNVLHSARIASYFRRGEEFGLPAECHRVDMAAVRARKRTMVSGVNEMYLENYKQ